MAVRITVHKSDLEKHRELSHQLTQLSREIKEFNKFCCYTPKEDFKQMTDLLEQYRVSYGGHSDQELMQ
ncbi:MAG TPA: hypothetical protein VF646_20895 [Cytophagales bacterium]